MYNCFRKILDLKSTETLRQCMTEFNWLTMSDCFVSVCVSVCNVCYGILALNVCRIYACCMFYSHINYRYIMGDQRMMSFGFSGSPPPFLANKI